MRLDVYLSENALAQSRTKASDMIKNGDVSVNGKIERKPSAEVCDDDTVVIEALSMPYVSRGALKLLYAAENFDIDFKDKTAVDLGASTGGFCEVMLNLGIGKVYAVDIGHGQLNERVSSDCRVVSLEGTNARYITCETFGECVDIVTSDLSFISQTLVYDAVVSLLKDNGIFVSLIKPQFEAGREKIGKNGIVKDKKVHFTVLKNVIAAAFSMGLICEKLDISPITGGDGNKEFLALFVKGGNISKMPDDNIIKKLTQ